MNEFVIHNTIIDRLVHLRIGVHIARRKNNCYLITTHQRSLHAPIDSLKFGDFEAFDLFGFLN